MMKHFITLIVLIITVNFAYGQSKNQERIDELTTLIEQSVEKGDYDKAAKLKEEKTIRLDIENALADQDYDKAEELKAKLEEIENSGQASVDDKKEDSPVKTEDAPSKREDIVVERQETVSGKPAINSKNIYFYLDFGIGAVTLDSYYSSYLYSQHGVSGARLGIDLKIGTKFYFNSNNSKMRLGLDVNWLSLNPQLGGYVAPAVNLSLVKPGFAFAYSFSDKAGIDAAFNLGTNLFFHPDESIFAAGLNLNPHVKFQISKFCVGFEYQSQLHLTDSFKTNLIALTAGLKL